MLRHAGTKAVVGVLGLLAAGGCTPGPVTARAQEDKMTGAGSAGGADARVVVYDAAPVEAHEVDAAVASRGSGGAAGRQVIDAGRASDAGHAADVPPGEMPKLSRRDAAADGALGAIPDASGVDRAPDHPGARTPRVGEVVIDELLVNPTGDDLGREWVEIESRAAEPLDLSQLHLATASTDVPAPAGTIAPGEILLLGQSSDASKNGGAPVTVTYSTKLILINADGQLSLCIGACVAGVVVDVISWGALDDDYLGHALVIDPATRTFCPASLPFGTGGSFGTPGAPNPPCTQNVDAGSQRDVSVAD
jgi:hypothetical protein